MGFCQIFGWLGEDVLFGAAGFDVVVFVNSFSQRSFSICPADMAKQGFHFFKKLDVAIRVSFIVYFIHFPDFGVPDDKEVGVLQGHYFAGAGLLNNVF